MLRQDASLLWLLPGVGALIAFAWLLTLVPGEMAAGRAFAAYGGVYISASILWGWLAEGARPDRWDLTGGLICLIGAAAYSYRVKYHSIALAHEMARLKKEIEKTKNEIA